MAASNPDLEIPDLSVDIEQQIKHSFEALIASITARRDVLLDELRKIMIDYQEKIKSQNRTLEELENFRSQLQSMEGKENVTSDFIQLSLAPIEKQISEVKVSLSQPPDIRFSYQASLIEEMVRNLGKIVSERKNITYTSKQKATHIIDIGSVSFLHDILLYVDDRLLYVANGESITTYNTTNWTRQGSYEFKDLSIRGIATTKNHCYVILNICDWDYSRCEIRKLTKDTFDLVKKQAVTGGTNSKKCDFKSIVISSEDEIFVADRGNNRICVFDSDLFFRREFGTNILKFLTFTLFEENTIIVILQENRVIVRDGTKELHMFNKQGDYIGTISQYGDISHIRYFCFDSSNNMICSYNNSVIIISPNKEVIHAIKGSEDLTGCEEIAVHKDAIIVVCSTLSCIKIF